MSGKKVTVRKQKIKKNHIREKLIFFTILILILLIVAAVARKLCPYDPYAQDLLLAQKPPGPEHILGTDRYGRDMFSRVLVGSTTSIYATLLLVSIVTVTGTVIGLIVEDEKGKPVAAGVRNVDGIQAKAHQIYSMTEEREWVEVQK